MHIYMYIYTVRKYVFAHSERKWGEREGVETKRERETQRERGETDEDGDWQKITSDMHAYAHTHTDVRLRMLAKNGEQCMKKTWPIDSHAEKTAGKNKLW